MQAFGPLFKQTIAVHTSIRAFSKEFKINSGFLYNVFTGEKRLPENTFQRILKEEPFSTSEQENLQLSYYSELFGEEQFQRVLYLIEFFNEIHSSSTQLTELKPSKHLFNSKIKTITTKENFLIILNDLLFNEIEQKSPKLYTNYSFEQSEIDNSVFQFLCSVGKNKADFKHIVSFGNNNAEKMYALKCHLLSMRYIILGYTTLICDYSPPPRKIGTHIPFLLHNFKRSTVFQQRNGCRFF